MNFEVAGEGAMGLVYLALDTELNRNVAFKIVRPDAPGSAKGPTPVTPLEASAPPPEPTLDARFSELKARFLQEAWVTGGMEHPGIVPVYELGQTEGGVPYYTMRFVRGQRTLETAIEELRGQSAEERLGVIEPFLKLCDAVGYAHAHGVIHRDLKPANVALGEFGEVVLLDWGLAKLRRSEEASGGEPLVPATEAREFHTDARGLGTVGYMPPEVVRGAADDPDGRCDVYSLGVILFQILTGCLPFPVEPFSEYYERVTCEEPPSAKSLNPAVPDALDQLCAQALRRDRDDRLGSARALADGVRHWQTQSALDREMEGLLRDAHSALSAAEDSKGPSRIRQTQRAMMVLATAREHRPDDGRLQHLQTRARGLHNRGIKETQSLSRRRMLVVGGTVLLVLLSLAAFFVAGIVNERRKEAEEANRATEAALAEVQRQREVARRESRAATAAKLEAEREAEAAHHAQERVLSVLEELHRAHRGRPGRMAQALAASIATDVARGNAQGVFLLQEQVRHARAFSRLPLGEALRSLDVPAELDARERIARQRTGEAQQAYLAARERGGLRERETAVKTLAVAQRAHADVLGDILRALEDQLGDTLPRPATVEQVQATLQSDDAFVSYGRVDDVAVAVVIEKQAARLESLGDQRRIDEAVSDLRQALQESGSITDPVQALNRLILRPLALSPTGRRVVVVPHDASLLVPFALLLPGREVLTVPSAGAYLHLRTLAPAAEEGVLAIADTITEQGPRLGQARREAEEVGTTILLGGDATWTRVSTTLRRRPRWHAVHLACHGRIVADSSGPEALALTPEEGDDGVLTGPEIASLSWPADLVVLSTASTEKSPAEMAATSLDLPRAFLFAGARCVLFTTIAPDDSATRALMTRFYALWHPRDGSPPLDASSALRGAQAFVREQARWRDPKYWASWILWGLP